MVNYARLVYYLETQKRRLHWESQKLENYREKRLRQIVRYAYRNSPFYRKKMKSAGVKPSDIETLGDMGKLPIVTKADIRKNLDEIISVNFRKQRLINLSTSGSTGNPLTLVISDAEDEFRKAGHLRANIVCGQKMRDRWATIAGSQFNEETSSPAKLQRFLRFYLLHRVPVFSKVQNQIAFLEKLGPQVLEGYSSSLLLLAKEVNKIGLKTIKPRIMFSGAELIDDYSRAFIEKTFGAPLYDHYATIEFERMAWQCPDKGEYHVNADSLIMEFVDEKGAEVSSGESGAIVCTSLFNYAMPLIRYAVGDIGVPSDNECSCGIRFPMMKMLEGRKDSIVLLPDGRLISPRALTVVMRQFDLYHDIDRFRIVQKDVGLIEILVKLVPTASEPDLFSEKLAVHFEQLLKATKSGAKIIVKIVDDMPLDKSGKLMAVSSEIKKPFP